MTRLVILGCGSMATSILTGMLREPKRLPPISHIAACVRGQASADRLQKAFGSSMIKIQPEINNNVKAVADADVVILSYKPHQLSSILGEKGMADAFAGKKIISILAGVSRQQITEALELGTSQSTQQMRPDIIRAMPTMGASLGESMTLINEPHHASSENIRFCTNLFKSIGRIIQVADDVYDSATALTGAAYALTTVALDGMVEGALQQGLSRKSGLEIAAQCLKGLAKMIEQGKCPSQIRDDISSPAGVTVTGIVELNKHAVRYAFAEAVIKATAHAKILGQTQC